MVDIINKEYSTTITSGSATTIVENDYTGSAVDARKNGLLEGPLSPKASTRFRQLLARPGIVVRYEKKMSSIPSLMITL